ncbi:MAG TPA: proline dehydrogenase family protein [Anaerolineaceae bacterium]|jgi:proline dehydrogenase
MLRSFFIYLSKLSWAQRSISQWRFARLAAGRFVAGDTVESALVVSRELNAHGIWVSLDHLGENTATREDADRATGDILTAIHSLGPKGIKGNVSIKLTQIGMLLDEPFARQNLIRILACARENHNFIRLDMEDSACVEKTLLVYEWARQLGYDNLGVVIQAYLYRSEDDVRRLLKLSGRIRLVKGAYQEPAQVAFPLKKDVDRNFDNLTSLIMAATPQAGSDRVPPFLALATHDRARIDFAIQQAKKLGVPREAYEFQMLYGIRRDVQAQLVSEGFAVRVYVPYGTHWYPYFMRRLAERPANTWFFLSNLVRG